MKERFRFVRRAESVGPGLLTPLHDDVVECEELLDHSDTQFVRRALVRALFAFNEGYLYWLKAHVSKWILVTGWSKGKIPIIKLLLLEDNAYRPSRQGKVESEPNRFPFLNYCAFVIRTAAECWNLDPTEPFSDNGWKEMQDDLQVRHRITHPKKPEDLVITEEELY